jgi:hypothetical protein
LGNPGNGAKQEDRTMKTTAWKVTGPSDGCWGEENAHGMTEAEAEAAVAHLHEQWPGAEFAVERELETNGAAEFEWVRV